MSSLRFLIPNIFTGVSLLVAAGSIMWSLEGNLELACWCILWCVLLDKADGTAARLLNASSRFGTEFDSMVDLIAFGLAPALLLYSSARNVWNVLLLELNWFLVLISLSVYVVAAASRLAKFNTVEHQKGDRYFNGAPSTLCGAIISSGVLLMLIYKVEVEWAWICYVTVFILGLSMVLPIPVPKVVPRKKLSVNLFQAVNIIAAYVCGIAMIFPEYLFILGASYLFWGTIIGFVAKHRVDNAKAG